MPQAWPDRAAFTADLARRGNDLTEAAVALQPVIAELLATLKASEGARYAAMTGSGATCFALYDDLSMASRAAGKLPAGWWRHAGRLL